MDAAENPDLVTHGRVAPDYGFERSEVPDDDEYDRILRLIHHFSELGSSWDDAGLICSMLAGRTLDELARKRGVTPQALHSRWKRIVQRAPVWNSVMNGMIGKGRGRKPTAKRNEQMRLF